MSNMWIIKEFLPEMIKRDEGQIVTVSSLSGLTGIPLLSDYSASKFASVGFTEALQMEMYSENRNITVTTICPYFFNSGMFEGVDHSIFFPLLKQERVADRIMASITQQESASITIPWHGAIINHSVKALFPMSFNLWIFDNICGMNFTKKL